METSLPKLNLNESSGITSSRATFRRKGQTYVIKNTTSDEDVSDVFTIIDNFYDDISNKSYWSDKKAQLYKFIHIFISIFIVCSGAIVGSLSINTFNNSNQLIVNNITSVNVTAIQPLLYVITILSYLIAAIKSLASLFNFEQRAITMKQISIQLRRIARSIKMLKTIIMPVEQYYKKLDELNLLVDEIEINMFGELNYTTDKIKHRDDVIQEEVKQENKNDVVVKMS